MRYNRFLGEYFVFDVELRGILDRVFIIQNKRL